MLSLAFARELSVEPDSNVHFWLKTLIIGSSSLLLSALQRKMALLEEQWHVATPPLHLHHTQEEECVLFDPDPDQFKHPFGFQFCNISDLCWIALRLCCSGS